MITTGTVHVSESLKQRAARIDRETAARPPRATALTTDLQSRAAAVRAEHAARVANVATEQERCRAAQGAVDEISQLTPPEERKRLRDELDDASDMAVRAQRHADALLTEHHDLLISADTELAGVEFIAGRAAVEASPYVALEAGVRTRCSEFISGLRSDVAELGRLHAGHAAARRRLEDLASQSGRPESFPAPEPVVVLEEMAKGIRRQLGITRLTLGVWETNGQDKVLVFEAVAPLNKDQK